MMHTVNRALMAAIGMTVLMACANVPAAGPSSGESSGPRFVLEMLPGPEFHKAQIAAWVEDEEGRFLGTLYATTKGARGAWAMAPSDGRPEALPVWYGRREGVADVVSSATAKGATVYGSALASNLPAGTYTVMLEINRSFDYNAAYPKSLGVNGQPSLVYKAALRTGGGKDEALFQPIGTGSVDGADGEIRPGLDGISTALELFSTLRVSFESE
ncbi:MAG: hypothetical protein CVV47_10180 [Spirochaetae bacterium HGW-Spirochaetae-3]|jgi:hypothetical protein|nr:MAG: hypothetical protein CVV47_10180 [Spirochaetae bacterium HGW-Spirochaetae-3]